MVPKNIPNKFDQAKIRLYLKVAKKNSHIAFKGIYVAMRVLVLVGYVRDFCVGRKFAKNLNFRIRIGVSECCV